MRGFHYSLRALLFLSVTSATAISAKGYATGTLLSVTVAPATVRQTGEKALSKVVATVILQDPAPAVFVCLVRSDDPTKISFPTIVFHQGDKKGMCEGKVQWKGILRARRIRITAQNTDAPERKLTFTVLLVPEEETAPGKPGGL